MHRKHFIQGRWDVNHQDPDDQGSIHEYVIEDAIYVPTNQAYLFCPQQRAKQHECNIDDTVAHCDTKGIMEWSHNQGITCHHKCVLLTGSNVSIAATAPRYLQFKAFTVLQNAFSVSANMISNFSDDESEADAKSKSEGAFKSKGGNETETQC